MRHLLFAMCLIFVAPFAQADRAGNLDALMRALDISGLVTVMQEEGRVYASDISAQMLAGGDALWDANVARIYEPGAMIAAVRRALDLGLNDDDIHGSLAFFGGEVGRRIVGLETSARRAMLDKAIEETARANFTDLDGSEDGRLALISEFVRVNDLIESNVTGGLGSNYMFYRGLIDGGGLDADEKDVLADVWAQEDEIRSDTRDWVFGYSLMAYQPLTDTELSAYIANSDTNAGRALNQALFEGFDRMYGNIAYALGLAAAQAMQGQDI